MKFKFDKHEEQTSVLCGGQNSKYRAEHKGKREDGYTHAEGPYPWRHQRLSSHQLLDSNICSEELDLGEDVPPYCRVWTAWPSEVSPISTAVLWFGNSGWMGCWWWNHVILLGKKNCVTWGLRIRHMVKDWLYISLHLSIGKLLISVRNHAVSPANLQCHSTCILSNIYKKFINIKSPKHSKSNSRQFDVKILQKNWTLLPFIQELAGTLSRQPWASCLISFHTHWPWCRLY